MKLLVVEDDENKRNQLVRLLSEAFSAATIDVSHSLQSGLRKIIAEEFDLVILDMTLPTFDPRIDEDGGRINHYAGREILSQMNRRSIETLVLVVTQFDRFGAEPEVLTLQELDVQLRNAYPKNYRGSVFYDVSTEAWRSAVVNRIVELKVGA